MFDSRTLQPRTLHNVSHVLQSLLMRLQADFFLLEKKTRQVATLPTVPTDNNAGDELSQHVDRSKRTIKQLSVLIEHIFECLYLANENREPRMKAVNVGDWQRDLEEQTRLVAPLIKFKKKRSDVTITIDTQMVEWTISMLVRAALQWANQGRQLTLHSMMPSSRQLALELSFIPHSQHVDGAVVTPQQAHSPIGEFYWEAASLACQHLGGTLSSKDEAYQGHMQLTLPILAKP